jgi:hypothetical protein
VFNGRFCPILRSGVRVSARCRGRVRARNHASANRPLAFGPSTHSAQGETSSRPVLVRPPVAAPWHAAKPRATSTVAPSPVTAQARLPTHRPCQTPPRAVPSGRSEGPPPSSSSLYKSSRHSSSSVLVMLSPTIVAAITERALHSISWPLNYRSTFPRTQSSSGTHALTSSTAPFAGIRAMATARHCLAPEACRRTPTPTPAINRTLGEP